MVEALGNLEWVMIPTKETLDAIYEMAEYNKTAGLHKRKRFSEVRPPHRGTIQMLIRIGTS